MTSADFQRQQLFRQQLTHEQQQMKIIDSIMIAVIVILLVLSLVWMWLKS